MKRSRYTRPKDGLLTVCVCWNGKVDEHARGRTLASEVVGLSTWVRG